MIKNGKNLSKKNQEIMSDLECFIRKRKESKKLLLMAHIIAGYPSFEENIQELEVMEEAGVDLVEVQFPFSEPIADGPVFSLANKKAIDQGIKTQNCFSFLEKIKNKFSFKVLIMGYYNTVFKYGLKDFTQRAKSNNISGLIIADLPLKENSELSFYCKEQNLSLICFVTPTQDEQSIQVAKKNASGFIYIIARRGVTGEKTILNKETQDLIKKTRKNNFPLALGFGLSTREDLLFLQNKVDIAIIGTAILRNWEQGGKAQLKKFFKEISIS